MNRNSSFQYRVSLVPGLMEGFRKRACGALFLLCALVWSGVFTHWIEPAARAAATTFTVNSTGDGVDANPGNGVCATASGNCTLRAAIQESNANPAKDTINFNIPGAGVHTITPASDLDSFVDAVVIDGYTQPGASENTLTNGDNAVLLIELNGTSTGFSALTLSNEANGSLLKGLVINRSPGVGILLMGDDIAVQGCFIGTNAAGTAPRANGFFGVHIRSRGPSFPGDTFETANNNIIGGTTPAARNIISGNGVTASFPGQGGGIGIGCFCPTGGNNGNQVQGNFIGTDASGTAAVPNNLDGVSLIGAPGEIKNNTIGGTSTGARNVISGNIGNGIAISSSVSLTRVQGNFLGTDVNGTAPLGNTLSGVQITNSSVGNTIGGAAGLGNTIAFNGGRGVNVTQSNTTGNTIFNNTIFANGAPGIDLGDNGVTPNDPLDADTGPNNLQNFPVLVSAAVTGNTVRIQTVLDSSSSNTFTVQFFSNQGCDSSGNGEGEKFIGSTIVNTAADGHAMFATAVPLSALSGQFIAATATDANGNTSEFSPCMQLSTPLSTFQFSQSSYTAFEDCTAVTLIVTRVGDNSTPATVDYATQSGTAVDKSDFTTAIGTLTFAPGETAKLLDVLISEDSITEGTETAGVVLSSPTGATLGTPATATLQIFDDAPEPAGNTIDLPDAFVCQHYHDFLNREDDAAGLAFWTGEISSCGADPVCIGIKRVNTSAAFFLSIEFQETGAYVIRSQRVAFGKKSENAGTRVNYGQFIHDARQVGEGVIVGQGLWQLALELNKQAYAGRTVNSPAFIALFPTSLNATAYVDALFASAVVTPTPAEKQSAIDAYGAAGPNGRAAALQSVADSNSVRQAEFNSAFVLMQYFGYLRRNPTDAPDGDDIGYQFWLTKLNAFNGDFNKAEMAKAFILSSEYRSRFGQP